MARKGQITKHEWTSPSYIMKHSISTCKHCGLKKEKSLSAGNFTQYKLNGVYVHPAPKCITRFNAQEAGE